MKQKQGDSSKQVNVELPTKDDANQTRKVGMMKASSDFDENDRENPFTKMASNPCHKGS